ncbi:response regulator [Halosolutus amylolyticus]|uniref:Response regulator n=1 Tax=Halosolutus amylolyticus TaxID=2932267 RepID=A0ABD5PT77_9EURY|nr:response regulator [Halosolutus amylolyticus]
MTLASQPPADSIDVLLVEDNPGDVRLTQEAFNAVTADISLHVTTDGLEALDCLSRLLEDPSASLPDLVLLDLNLPRMGGFEFLENVRSDSDLANLPVLVLTSSEATEDVRESYDRCANAYLTKPTDPDEFVTIAEAVVNFWFEQAALPPIPS